MPSQLRRYFVQELRSIVSGEAATLSPMSRLRGVFAFATLAILAGCVHARPPPGMIAKTPEPHAIDPTLLELARAETTPDERALLVVYPRSGCSGSASMVFLDDRGSYLGAVAPGSAALLRVPLHVATLRVFSSVEVTAAKGSWFVAEDVELPPFPAGLLLSAQRFSALLCGSGHYASAVAASKSELESVLAEQPMKWLVPEPEEGQAWLDAHRARVRELRGRTPVEGPPWVVPLHAVR